MIKKQQKITNIIDMKEKFKVIKMLIGMLKKKNTGIFICMGKKETLILSCGKGQDIINMLENAINEDQTTGRFLNIGVLANIIHNGEVPYLNDEGLEKLQKIVLNIKEEQE